MTIRLLLNYFAETQDRQAASFVEKPAEGLSCAAVNEAMRAQRRFSDALSFAILDAKSQVNAMSVSTPMISTIVHLVADHCSV